MKPKTALQRQVVKLSAKLPAITKNQTAWAIKKCFEVEGFHRAKRFGVLSAEKSLRLKNLICHTLYWVRIVLVVESTLKYKEVVKGYIHLKQCTSRL